MKSPADRRSPVDGVLQLGPPLLLGLAPLIFLRTGGEFENHPKVAFLQWGIALLALLWLGRGGPGSIRSRSPIDVPVTSFYVACWLPLLQAVNVFEAWATLLHWGAAVILYFVLVHTLRGPAAVPRFFLAAVLGSGAVCLIGLSQALLGLDWIPQSAVPGSTFSNRNMAAHYVAICFPLALGLIVVSRRLRDKGLGVACLLLSLLYLWYTRTHSAWLAVLVVIVLSAVGVPWFTRRAGPARGRARLIFAIAMLVLVASLVGLYSAADGLEGEGQIARRLGSMAGVAEGTAGLRLIFWKNTLAMVRDHPWLGVGLGNFKLHYPLYHRAVELDWTFDEEHQLERAHNDHLQILAELGLVGFGAWISIFATAFYVAWNFRRARQEWIPTQAFFVCLGIVSFLVVACFSFPMERAIPPVYLFALLGMLGFLHIETAIHADRGRLASGLRWAGVLLLVGFLATSVPFALKAVRTDVYYTKGVQRTNAGEHEGAVSLLERARRLSPRDTNVLLMLADNHTTMGRCDLALTRLREVLDLHPHKLNAISNTGYCYLQQRDYREAERYFLMTLELTPDSPETHTNLGTAYFRQGQHDLAVDAYRKAIDLGETKLFLPGVRTAARFLQPRLLLANVLVAQQRLDEAIEQYEEILVQDPGRQDVRRLLAELYRTIGEPGTIYESPGTARPAEPR